MAILVGSARVDERGKYSGGKAGDQTGKEVSTQPFYIHKLGWYILRPKKIKHSQDIAQNMKTACSNPYLGYDQNERLGVMKNGINSRIPTECDCSSLVRACIKEATGVDVGNFTTVDEASVLEKSGLFEKRITYSSTTKVYDGDVLVTKSKGHTVIVVSGNSRHTETNSYSKTNFLHECAQALGVPNTTGTEILKKTITVSKKTNSKHPVVACIQRRIISFGISCGASGADGDFGKNTEDAVKELQTRWTKNPDGIITANNTTWKYLLGIL